MPAAFHSLPSSTRFCLLPGKEPLHSKNPGSEPMVEPALEVSEQHLKPQKKDLALVLVNFVLGGGLRAPGIA